MPSLNFCIIFAIGKTDPLTMSFTTLFSLSMINCFKFTFPLFPVKKIQVDKPLQALCQAPALQSMKGSTQICILFDLITKKRKKESSKTVDTKSNHDHHGVRGEKSFCHPLFYLLQRSRKMNSFSSAVAMIWKYLSVDSSFSKQFYILLR